MLQPDNTDTNNQLLAYGFASQPARFPPPPALNATITTLLETPAFSPTASARWINTLFFLSLILSLASALFGILAKQWLREYMQWNSPLGAPKENIIVRQIRIQAWEAWQVASIIAAIPALLELAMVLFLVGLVILLWTLDSIVAIIVTVFVAIFLAIVFAFTLLPVIFKRCPYKSPTAWACNRLLDILRAAVQYIRPCGILLHRRGIILRRRTRRIVLRHRGTLLPRGSLLLPSTWRLRDLDDCRQCRQGSTLAAMESIFESKKLGSITHDHASAGSTWAKLSESIFLLTALEWVHQASQDPRVERYMEECVQRGFHPTDTGDSAMVHSFILWTRANDIIMSPSETPAIGTVPDVGYIVRNVQGFTFQRAHQLEELFNRRFSGDHLVLLMKRTIMADLSRHITASLQSLASLPQPTVWEHPFSSGRHRQKVDSIHRNLQSLRRKANDASYIDALRWILANSDLCTCVGEARNDYAPLSYLSVLVLACDTTRVSWNASEGKLGES